ncbi:hypothetical protein ACSBR1_022643 [Camellia fascicularis]
MVDDVKFNKYVEAMVDIHQIHASDTTRDRRANWLNFEMVPLTMVTKTPFIPSVSLTYKIFDEL